MNRKPSILVIFLSVFIDLIGFGIVLPLLPGYAEDNFRPDFSGKGLVIGGIIASFLFMQFLFAPAWRKIIPPPRSPSGHAHQQSRRRRLVCAVCSRIRHERDDWIALDSRFANFR